MTKLFFFLLIFSSLGIAQFVPSPTQTGAGGTATSCPNCGISGFSKGTVGSNTSRDYILVSDYGILNDSTTDQTTALNNLFASAPSGSTIEFPCPANSNGFYKVTGQLNFVGNLIYKGYSNSIYANACSIVSTYGGGTTAFNFVGQQHIKIQNLILFANNSASPNKTIAMFGSTNSQNTRNGSFYVFDNVAFEGYANTAAIYAISSEVWHSDSMYIVYNGGGATYTNLYLSSQDDLGICSSCYTGSLSATDIRFTHFFFADETATCAAGSYNIGIAAVTTSSAVGDVSFTDGYLSSRCNGSGTAYSPAFRIGQNQGLIKIDGIRDENATKFVEFVATTSPVSVNVTNSTLSTVNGGLYFIDASSTNTANSCGEKGNVVSSSSGINQNSGISSSYAGVSLGNFQEPFIVSVATYNPGTINVNNGVLDFTAIPQFIGNGTPANCMASLRGQMIVDRTGTPDYFKVCEAVGYNAYSYATFGQLVSTSASIGGSALLAGACASTTTTVTGAQTSQAVEVSPVTDPGVGNYWQAFVSSTNNVTVRVCAAVAGTPTASTYNIRVIQ